MHYLAPEEKDEFIELVRDDNLPGIFEADYCALRKIPYSFYKDGHLLILENLSIAPPFALDYLQSGQHIVYLDGSAAPFEILNAHGCLNLNDETIIDYLEFFCTYVNQRPDNILLLRNPDHIPFQDTIYIDFHFDKNNYGEKDIKVKRSENGYIVNAPFVFAGKIDLGIATINDNGDIHIERENPR